jgi:hypothetical protein
MRSLFPSKLAALSCCSFRVTKEAAFKKDLCMRSILGINKTVVPNLSKPADNHDQPVISEPAQPSGLAPDHPSDTAISPLHPVNRFRQE